MSDAVPGPAFVDGEPTVVLLHGVFMDTSLWDPVVSMLDVPTLALDMPGHGVSGEPIHGTTLEDHVAWLEQVLRDEGARGAIVVGHSWGGMTALRLAARSQDLVSGLALINTPLLRTRGSGRLGFHVQRLLLRAGLLPAATYGRLAAGALIGDERRTTHPADITAMAARTQTMGRDRLAETLRSVLLEPDDALALVEGLTIPWLALAGEDDYVLAGGVRQRLAALGDLRTVAGGHASPLEDPSAVAAAITDLLAATATR